MPCKDTYEPNLVPHVLKTYLEECDVDERGVVVDELEAEELHGVAVLEVGPRPRLLHVGQPQRDVSVDLNKWREAHKFLFLSRGRENRHRTESMLE